jgi:lactoylglutathione lyase
MLKLPADEFVTLELVCDGRAVESSGSEVTHIAVQVTSMAAVIETLSGHGIQADVPTSPDGSKDFLTSAVVDPDGHRIELVQWPAGHAAGLSAADWPSSQ